MCPFVQLPHSHCCGPICVSGRTCGQALSVYKRTLDKMLSSESSLSFRVLPSTVGHAVRAMCRFLLDNCSHMRFSRTDQRSVSSFVSCLSCAFHLVGRTENSEADSRMRPCPVPYLHFLARLLSSVLYSEMLVQTFNVLPCFLLRTTR